MTTIPFVILQIWAFCVMIFLHRAKTRRGPELRPAAGFPMRLQRTIFTRFALRARTLERLGLARVSQLPVAQAA
ncbi:MAG TPA: hypothetical protein VFT60_13105 [Bryobacteraceae bacterium]|nr:hypothetical protein [Bryobacteraceae bacterium]